MTRPSVTKGEVARVVAGVIQGGLKPGSFAIRVDKLGVHVLPAKAFDEQPSENPWDEVLPGAA